jgi:hypothetical protein
MAGGNSGYPEWSKKPMSSFAFTGDLMPQRFVNPTSSPIVVGAVDLAGRMAPFQTQPGVTTDFILSPFGLDEPLYINFAQTPAPCPPIVQFRTLDNYCFGDISIYAGGIGVETTCMGGLAPNSRPCIKGGSSFAAPQVVS